MSTQLGECQGGVGDGLGVEGVGGSSVTSIASAPGRFEAQDVGRVSCAGTAVRTSAQITLPGPGLRSVTPQASARVATRRRPRPESASGGGVLGVAVGGRCSVRVSVTSRRRRSVAGSAARRTWKLRPGTRPCWTALAQSSAAMRVTVSLAGVSCGWPQAASWAETSRRARRALRGVEEKGWLNSGGGGGVGGVERGGAVFMGSAWPVRGMSCQELGAYSVLRYAHCV